MKIKKIMPPTWLLIAIVAMLTLHFLIPAALIIPRLWNLLGLIPIFLGVAINMNADKAFHQVNTTVKPFEESSSLVTRGVFRISRNPMYLGFVLILIGISIFLRSITSYLVIIAFAILIDRIYITVEEQMLSEQFGVAWEVYKNKVRRWL